MRKTCLFITAAAIAVVASAAEAGVTRFKCRLSQGKDALSFEFVYDDLTHKAHVVGNAGLADVVPHIGTYGVTFLEFLSTGVVQSTTIEFRTGAAVHSRHTIMIDKLMPSQVLGTCTRS
jgi:hypothetical protein